MRSAPSGEDSRELLREVATLLMTVGVVVWVLREGGELGSFAALCILGLPALVFLRSGLAAHSAGRGSRPWQAVSLISGLVLAILALRELVDWIGSPGDAGLGINVFWTLGLVAALAWFAALRRGIRFGLLFAALAATVSFSGLCQAVLPDGIEANYGLYRALLVGWAIFLAGLAMGLARGAATGGSDAPPPAVASATSPGGSPDLWRASELITAAGLSVVFAGSLGLLSTVDVVRLELGVDSVRSSLGWEVVLLIGSVSLVIAGAGLGVRGPTWVGALGLVAFCLLIGLDVAERSRDPHTFGVWPWFLLIVGAVGLLAASVPEASRASLLSRRSPARRSGAPDRRSGESDQSESSSGDGPDSG